MSGWSGLAGGGAGRRVDMPETPPTLEDVRASIDRVTTAVIQRQMDALREENRMLRALLAEIAFKAGGAAGSSSGKTRGFDPRNSGSNPDPATKEAGDV